MAHPYNPLEGHHPEHDQPSEHRELERYAEARVPEVVLARGSYEELIDRARAEGAAAEREKIRLLALAEAERLDHLSEAAPLGSVAARVNQAGASAIGRFAATLEKP